MKGKILCRLLFVLCLSTFLLYSVSHSVERKEIVFGGIVSVTGAEAMVGADHKWAYEQAVRDINAAGGIFVKELGRRLPVRLIIADDKSDASQAAAAAERLIKREKADFLLGSTTVYPNVPAMAVAEKYRKFYISTTYWPEEFLNQKYNWVAVSFFWAQELLKSSVDVMDLFPAQIRPKKVCVMVTDNPEGQVFGGGASKIVPAKGYELAMYEPYTLGMKDFSSSILKMRRAGVEAIIYFGSSTDAITLVRQMKEHDFTPTYVWGARGMWPNEFYEALGSDADYITHDGHWSEAYGYGLSKELAERYKKEFGGRTSVTIGNFYSIVQALAQAIEEAGSLDSKRVRDVFYSGRFVAKNTTNGDLKFNEKGLATFPPVALQWYKGERMPVWPPKPETWTLKPIPPWKERK